MGLCWAFGGAVRTFGDPTRRLAQIPRAGAKQVAQLEGGTKRVRRQSPGAGRTVSRRGHVREPILRGVDNGAPVAPVRCVAVALTLLVPLRGIPRYLMRLHPPHLCTGGRGIAIPELVARDRPGAHTSREQGSEQQSTSIHLVRMVASFRALFS